VQDLASESVLCQHPQTYFVFVAFCVG